MAYFSNGTEGEMWEARNCAKCALYGNHTEDSCPILFVHQMFNYDQLDPEKTDIRNILNVLIPTRMDGFADQCSLFTEKEKADRAEIKRLEEEIFRYNEELSDALTDKERLIGAIEGKFADLLAEKSLLYEMLDRMKPMPEKQFEIYREYMRKIADANKKEGK